MATNTQNQPAPSSDTADKKTVPCAKIEFTMWHKDYLMHVPVGNSWKSVCEQIKDQLDTGVVLFRGAALSQNAAQIPLTEAVSKDETISVRRKILFGKF